MKISKYNAKWIMVYTIYCLIMFFSTLGNDTDGDDLLLIYIALPITSYIILPFLLKKTNQWKIIKWIDNKIDSVYNTIIHQK